MSKFERFSEFEYFLFFDQCCQFERFHNLNYYVSILNAFIISNILPIFFYVYSNLYIHFSCREITNTTACDIKNRRDRVIENQRSHLYNWNEYSTRSHRIEFIPSTSKRSTHIVAGHLPSCYILNIEVSITDTGRFDQNGLKYGSMQLIWRLHIFRMRNSRTKRQKCD